MKPAVPILIGAPIPFAPALALQEALLAARQRDEIPDTVIFLQHTPVITLGRRGRANFLLARPEELAARGIDLVTASRGGDVTLHAPGQLIIYPILKLGGRRDGTHSHLTSLEELAIRTAHDLGVPAYRREGKNGAWHETGKIAAIGFHVQRWVTMHGMSYNIDLDLRLFDLIIGCGLVGEKVSSLQKILGTKTPTLPRVQEVMAARFQIIFQRQFQPPQDFPALQKILSNAGIPANA